jgi:ABC-type molybdenum transport system ATPase subunit/photorepair protein PhrA
MTREGMLEWGIQPPYASLEEINVAHQRRIAMRDNIAWQVEREERWKIARKAKGAGI